MVIKKIPNYIKFIAQAYEGSLIQNRLGIAHIYHSDDCAVWSVGNTGLAAIWEHEIEKLCGNRPDAQS
jgi:hypothetical protein